MQEFLEIGQIVNTHGLKGYLKIMPFTDDVSIFDTLKTVYVMYKGNLVNFNIEDVRYVKNMLHLKLENINDIDEAEKYKGCYLKIDRNNAKKLDKNTYFIVDLIGIDVYNMNNEKIGVLEDIIKTGSNDVYFVKCNDGKQILLPAISKAIKKIDIENNLIIVDVNQGVVNEI